jgi:hypothetical protein
MALICLFSLVIIMSIIGISVGIYIYYHPDTEDDE